MLFTTLLYSLSSFWTFFFIIIIVILFIKISKLNARLDNLEKNNFVIKSSTVSQMTHSLADSVPLLNTQNQKPDISPSVHEDDVVSLWFKENLLLKVGMLMIMVGFGWFVSYAFAHNWIGPVGRITLGVIIGTIVTVLGTFRLTKNQLQGRALTILGSALIIISILAGEYYYGFFTPSVVLFLVFLVSLYVTLTSAGYDDEKLAVYGILVSLFAPYFSHSLGIDRTVLFLYLAVASLAVIWVSVFKRWKNIILVGITGIFFYSLAYVFDGAIGSYDQKYVFLFVGYGISLMYLLVNVWSMVKNMLDSEKEDIYLAVVNSILILLFTTKIVPEVYQSLVLAVWMLIFAFSGFFVFIKTRSEKLFYIHSCVAVLFLGVATSIELSGPTLVIAFAIESAILIIASYIVTNNAKISEYMSLTFILPAIMSMQSLYSYSWKTNIFHSDFVALLLMAVLLTVLGLFFKFNDRDFNDKLKLYHVALISASAYIFALIWLCSHSLIKDQDTAVFLSLFIYTIIGLATHFYGIFNQNSKLKKYGMTLLVLVVLRLVLVDVWNMDLVLRVITFIVLGVMFMSSAFISKKQNTQN